MAERVGRYGHFWTDAQAIKIASILVHIDEGLSKDGHEFDLTVVKSLLEDQEVKAWLESFPSVMLPARR